MPHSALKTLYYSLIHSHLNYAIEIWSSASLTTLKPLINKQKTAIRIINNLKNYSHTEPHFKKLEILPLPLLADFNKLILMQQVTQKLSPSSLHNTWVKNREKRRQQDPNIELIELRNDDDYFTVPFRTNQTSRFPLSYLPPIWNDLNPNIQIIRRKSEFSHALKQHYLQSLSYTPSSARLLCPSCHLDPVLNSP